MKQITVQVRKEAMEREIEEKLMAKPDRTGVIGFKEITIKESSRSDQNPENPHKKATVKVSVKDQSPSAKAMRHMHHYFDYDEWLQMKNTTEQKKSKPDPSKKKPKKLKI